MGRSAEEERGMGGESGEEGQRGRERGGGEELQKIGEGKPRGVGKVRY